MSLFDNLLRSMRQAGWMVAAHNDYNLDGKFGTFWLFVKDDRAVKGEGATDFEALSEANVKRIKLELEEQVGD